MRKPWSPTVFVVALLLVGTAVAAPTESGEGTAEKKKDPPRGGLNLDDLMRGTKRSTATPAPTAPAPGAPAPTAAPPARTRSLDDPLLLSRPEENATAGRGQLSLDGIEAGREAVKVEAARLRVDELGRRLASSCTCVADGSCFPAPRFEHDEMNAAIDDEAATYERQARELCAQWAPEAADALPDDRRALAEAEQHIQLLLDTKSSMHAALDARVGEFRAEEERIRQAIAAEARARAAAEARAAQQQKKKSGFLASMLTLGAGAVVADSLGMQVDPEMLARTSVGVGKAVQNGEGVGGAIGAGVTGFSEMARTATPKIDVPAAPSGDYIADAMAHVKTFPEPSAAAATGPGATGGSAADPFGMLAGGAPGTGGTQPGGATAGDVRDFADLFAGGAAMPDGISQEAMDAANAAMQRGAEMAADGVTPGGPGTDAFGVRDPTRERFTFVCKERSNIPLSDGAGGTKYYYDRKITGVIAYWTPACGPAFKAYYIAYACNNIDDFPKVEADCLSACGARDCRDKIYEDSVLGGALR